MDPAFYDQLIRTGFGHRSTPRGPDSVAYALADKSYEVLIPRKKWEALGREYVARTRSVRSGAISYVFLMPFAILFFALFIADWLPHSLALMLLLLGLGSWAGSWLIWYPWKVRQISQDIELRLRAFPRTYRSVRDPARQPRALQVLMIFFTGPYLLVSAYGEFAGPDAFRNTPWVGRDFGIVEWIGLCVLLAWIVWPRLMANRR